MKHVWLLDSGHGGMIDGNYTTPLSKGKQFTHDNEPPFYEGVFNRLIKNKLIERCKREDIYYIDVCPTEIDLPLDIRVDTVNDYYRRYSNAVMVSLHSNAGGGTGFEVWTSVGQTRSDKFAEVYANVIIDTFKGAPFRPDTVDGDLDKESQFYVLKWTKCPAILPECLFFDNLSDYKLLIDPEFQDEYVDMLMKFFRNSESLDL